MHILACITIISQLISFCRTSISNIKYHASDVLDNSIKHTEYQNSNSSRQCKDTPNQTLPKSRKEVRKQKSFSVQICQDPSHLSNVKEFKLNTSATNTPLRINGKKGELFL